MHSNKTMVRKELFRNVIDNSNGKYRRTEEDCLSKIFRAYMKCLADDFAKNGFIDLNSIGFTIYIKHWDRKFNGKFCSSGIDWIRTKERWNRVGKDKKFIFNENKDIYRIGYQMRKTVTKFMITNYRFKPSSYLRNIVKTAARNKNITTYVHE